MREDVRRRRGRRRTRERERQLLALLTKLQILRRRERAFVRSKHRARTHNAELLLRHLLLGMCKHNQRGEGEWRMVWGKG